MTQPIDTPEPPKPAENDAPLGSNSSSQRASSREKWAIGGILVTGVAVAAVMTVGLVTEAALYEKLFVQAREATRACPGVYLAYTSALAPFRSFSFFRAATVFLSFAMFVLGAAFSLARIRGGGNMQLGEGASSVKVESAYPGIFMIALSASLIGLGLTRTASPETHDLNCETNPVWSKGGDKEPMPLHPEYSLSAQRAAEVSETEPTHPTCQAKCQACCPSEEPASATTGTPAEP